MSSKESSLSKIAAEVAYSVIPSLKEQLEEAAKTAGWPDKLIKSMFIDFDGTSISVKYPDQLASEIDDLEYGKPFGLPNPVIRPFIYRSETIIKEAVATVALDKIFELEGII